MSSNQSQTTNSSSSTQEKEQKEQKQESKEKPMSSGSLFTKVGNEPYQGKFQKKYNNPFQ